MPFDHLEELIESPEFHRRLHLDRFHKGYSFGIGQDPDIPSKPALYLDVDSDEATGIPDVVNVDGESVRIIVRLGFKLPVPYSARR